MSSAKPLSSVTRDRIKVGVIGVGYLGRHHARLYAELPGATLVGVADVDAGRLAEIAAATGAEGFADYRDLLAKVDAVSVVVPTTLHHQVAKTCLDAGVDVLLEKPMTVTIEEADELIALADAKGRLIQIGHIERFNGAVRALGKGNKQRLVPVGQQAEHRPQDQAAAPAHRSKEWRSSGTTRFRAPRRA